MRPLHDYQEYQANSGQGLAEVPDVMRHGYQDSLASGRT